MDPLNFPTIALVATWLIFSAFVLIRIEFVRRRRRSMAADTPRLVPAGQFPDRTPHPNCRCLLLPVDPADVMRSALRETVIAWGGAAFRLDAAIALPDRIAAGTVNTLDDWENLMSGRRVIDPRCGMVFRADPADTFGNVLNLNPLYSDVLRGPDDEPEARPSWRSVRAAIVANFLADVRANGNPGGWTVGPDGWNFNASGEAAR